MVRTSKKTSHHGVKERTTSPMTSNVLLTRTASKRKNDPQPDFLPIRAGHCSQCNVRIPSGQLQRALVGKAIQCEHCHSALHIDVADTELAAK
ncbi:MAG: hypothetical protein ACRD2L_25825 [Terriglobia bacterium]